MSDGDTLYAPLLILLINDLATQSNRAKEDRAADINTAPPPAQ